MCMHGLDWIGLVFRQIFRQMFCSRMPCGIHKQYIWLRMPCGIHKQTSGCGCPQCCVHSCPLDSMQPCSVAVAAARCALEIRKSYPSRVSMLRAV